MSRAGAYLLLATLVFAVGCGSTPQVTLDQSVKSEELAKADLSYYWRSAIALQPGEKITRIWHLDENVYVLSNTNRVRAFDAAVGQQKWSKVLGNPEQKVFTPCHTLMATTPTAKPAAGDASAEQPKPAAGGTSAEQPKPAITDVVIFNTITSALIFERDSGTLLKTIDLARSGIAANSGGVSDGKLLYLGSIRGWYYGIDLALGFPVWSQTAGGMISANPVYYAGRLYIASRSSRDGRGGNLISCKGGMTAETVWTRKADDSYVADFAVDDRGVFAGNRDYSVYAYHLTGDPLWTNRFRTNGPITRAVLAGQSNVYASSDANRFYAIDLATGREKWAINAGGTIVMEAKNQAMVVTDRNELMVVDAAIGKPLAVVPMTGLTMFVPNTKLSAIFAASNDGLLVCLRLRAAGHVTPAMLQNSTGTGPAPFQPTTQPSTRAATQPAETTVTPAPAPAPAVPPTSAPTPAPAEGAVQPTPAPAPAPAVPPSQNEIMVPPAMPFMQ